MEEIIHGGDLIAAEKKFGIPKKDWLDLSTGINPNTWPIPELPDNIWQQLPNDNDNLIKCAREYYDCHSLLAIPGSQFAIQTLPKLFSKEITVALPEIAYQEYRAAWERQGNNLFYYSEDSLNLLEEKLDSGTIDILIVINPNNPTCTFIAKQTLNSWLDKLKKNNGYLIIDEAFMDATPEYSMADSLENENLIILKSVGKFFGLAGLRLGFILANVEIRKKLKIHLGPWSVNHPARWIGAKALKDKEWHNQIRKQLKMESNRLYEYLRERINLDSNSINSTHLFVSILLDKEIANKLYLCLAKQGVLIRHIPTKNKDYLRFGLLKNEIEWKKLIHATQFFDEKISI